MKKLIIAFLLFYFSIFFGSSYGSKKVDVGHTSDNSNVENLKIQLKKQQYTEWKVEHFIDLFLHPMDLPRTGGKTIFLELPLGVMMTPFLLLEDIKNIPNAEEHPYLDEAIYTPNIEKRSKSSENYALMRTGLYAVINFITMIIFLFGNSSLIVASFSALFSWFFSSLATTLFEKTIVSIMTGAIPLLLGARIIYLLENFQKKRKQWDSLNHHIRSYKKTIFFTIVFIFFTIYIISIALRLDFRVKKNKSNVLLAQKSLIKEREKKKKDRDKLDDLDKTIKSLKKEYKIAHASYEKEKKDLEELKNKVKEHKKIIESNALKINKHLNKNKRHRLSINRTPYQNKNHKKKKSYSFTTDDIPHYPNFPYNPYYYHQAPYHNISISFPGKKEPSAPPFSQ